MAQVLQTKLPEHLVAKRTAQRREWGTQVIACAIAVVCFVGAGLLMGPVNRIRKERQLLVDPDTLGTLPPDIALLGKLGTFRALLIDWASIRAERLKDEGKTYEAHQLHETICALAPRFPKVWANAAWNMAYNISVMQYTPEERWQWVQNGIKILRDKGIKYNPRSVTLYKELAWIFWHKIGDYLDDEHLNYKKALAVEMERVLGPPPVGVSDQEYFDWFRKIVDAPRDLDAFLARDAEVARYWSRLEGVELTKPDDILEFAARNLRPGKRIKDLIENAPEPDSIDVRRLAVISDASAADARDRLFAALRSKVLRERYKMDLDWMLDLMENQYGPLDWRNAFSHALYWSSWGDKQAKGRAANDEADAMNTARFVFFSLESIIGRGKIVLWPNFDDPFESYIAMTPDTRFIRYLYDTYMRLGKEQFGDRPDFKEGTPGPNYMTGFVTNMHAWIELLYLEGGERNLEMAQNFYAWLRDNNLNPDGSKQKQYLATVEEFVIGATPEQLFTYKQVSGIIRSFIQRALKQLSIGQADAATRSLQRAKACRERWMADTRVDFNDRRKMQEFPILFRDQAELYLQSPEIAPLFKVTLWDALPLAQRQAVYDRLQTYFVKLCGQQKPPWSVTKAFPEPPGMEEARQRQIDYVGERQKERESGSKFKD